MMLMAAGVTARIHPGGRPAVGQGSSAPKPPAPPDARDSDHDPDDDHDKNDARDAHRTPEPTAPIRASLGACDGVTLSSGR
jgi:hypothetical protein